MRQSIVFSLFLQLLIGCCMQLNAQTSERVNDPQTAQQWDEFNKVSKTYDRGRIFETTPDSTMVTTFAFLVEVEKDSNEVSVIRSLVATDSSAYRMIPDYHQLKTINFGVFMKDRKKATFVIPFYIQIFNSKGDELKWFSIVRLKFFSPKKGENISDFIYFPPTAILISKLVME